MLWIDVCTARVDVSCYNVKIAPKYLITITINVITLPTPTHTDCKKGMSHVADEICVQILRLIHMTPDIYLPRYFFYIHSILTKRMKYPRTSKWKELLHWPHIGIQRKLFLCFAKVSQISFSWIFTHNFF